MLSCSHLYCTGCPCRCMLWAPIYKAGRMMLFSFFLCSQSSQHFFAWDCFCALYFRPEEPDTDDAQSSIIALSWYRRVASRRRLKLILALFCLMPSSGNSKPTQIAERRSHEDIRWLQAIYLGCLLSSSEYIKKVDNESKQRQAGVRFLLALQRDHVGYGLLTILKQLGVRGVSLCAAGINTVA